MTTRLLTYLCAVNLLVPLSANSQIGLNFDGSNDYVQTTFGGVTGTAAITFEAWVKVDSNISSKTTIITIVLNFNSATTANVSVSNCGDYILPSGSDTVYQSGTYMDTIVNAAGCDSIITVDVTIGQTDATSENVKACFEFVSPSGKVVDVSSTFMDTLTTIYGCDSVVTFNLTVNAVTATATKTSSSLLFTTFQPDSLQWLKCGNNFTVIAGETNSVYQPSSLGEYAVEVWKDGCVDTTECISYDPWGIADLNGNSFSVYPNPTNGDVLISAVMDRVEVYDLTGQRIEADIEVIGNETRLILPDATGIYIQNLDDEAHRVVKR